jgi:hypothetical protein
MAELVTFSKPTVIKCDKKGQHLIAAINSLLNQDAYLIKPGPDKPLDVPLAA